MYATITQQRHWSGAGAEHAVQVGHSGSFRRIPYNVNFRYDRPAHGPANRQMAVSVLIPLGKTNNTTFASTSMTMAKGGA